MKADRDSVFAALNRGAASANAGPQFQEQVQVWDEQLPVLRDAAARLIDAVPGAGRWSVLLEFLIPRMMRRIDCVLLGAGVIYVLEFKRHSQITSADRRQVEEYCLDLRDFHEASCGVELVPLLVAGAPGHDRQPRLLCEDAGLHCVRPNQLADAIIELHRRPGSGPIIDGEAWDNAPYRPVPTIIEAAEMMFAGHGVRDIGHAHADATNLTTTSEHLVQTVLRARAQGRHVICFVTGVPGAGKTLTGLNVVHDARLGRIGAADREGATYLSGNGPLVQVLREALARDEARRSSVRMVDARRHASRAIQNVHGFIWDNYSRAEPPWEHAIVFDEAQRAWDAPHVDRKRRVRLSEPQLIAEIMGRHPDWAVVVGLVGGGQEIHDGEAGLQEWGRAIAEADRPWEIEVSPQMVTGQGVGAGSTLFPEGAPPGLSVRRVAELHLPVSLRTFRADAVASWVDHLLAGQPRLAADEFARLGDYPIVATRDLECARNWLRSRTRGLRRCGLVASSGARRLRAWGVDMASRPDVVPWFLGPPEDVRSSYYLELAASEFEIQGLELDHVGLCWGGDLTWHADEDRWRHRCFRGTRWQRVRSLRDREYLINKYRVLLTRARESLVIWVPPGHPDDPTALPGYFDETWEYLRACGLPDL